MTTTEKCLESLRGMGIEAFEESGKVFIVIKDIILEITREEVKFQAEYYESNNSYK